MPEIYDRLPYSSREAMWLIYGGVIPEEACRRAGVRAVTLERTLLRHGISRTDVANAANDERRTRAQAA